MSLVYFKLLLLLALTIFGVEGKAPKRQRIKDSDYTLSITRGLLQHTTYNIYSNGYQDGNVPVTEFKFRRTLTGKPILDISAWNDKDSRPVSEYRPLSSLVKDVTGEKTKVDLSKVPYVIFRHIELIEKADRYLQWVLDWNPESFTVTPEDEWWWDEYSGTWSFKEISKLFSDRGIKEVQVKLRKGRFVTQFVLNKVPKVVASDRPRDDRKVDPEGQCTALLGKCGKH
ncbi:hypothetical protein CSHISOI_08177 [Colletotrichum shisoi]|uniref:Uncharacterized protein n=1 Tax=Colletotrichum shisoi TaxID=2078593 RepID=A0A5Q4BJG2_9PEZI|nr:hypothetical protein CSHISOI_08177 [Colletotrichum shisoi]